jgi:allantoinase
MPGLVDTHVHVNEPGRTAWEGFESATRAAARGGVTTLVDMPLNSIPPTTTADGLARKIGASDGKLWVDVGFCGGVVPGNVGELRELRARGVVGFKCFLTTSGVEEFPRVEERDLRDAMRSLADLDAPLLVHAELDGPIEDAARKLRFEDDPRHYSTWLDARPRRAEDEAIALLVRLARELHVRVHVVHLSSSDALATLHRAREEGVAIGAETCPHYLSLAAEEVPDGATEYKCAPPIRERANREHLWNALASGLIDQVVSDHSPCVPELKHLESGDFRAAWGGIASLQLSLPVVWTQCARRGYSIERMSAWMSRAPAQLAGIHARKGTLAPGFDADIVVWNPDERFTVEPSMLEHKNKLTPYRGRELLGVVASTWVRGRRVWDRASAFDGPHGTIVRKEAP